MQRIKELIRTAASRIEERPLRERLLVLVTAVVLIAVLWHLLLFQGQQQRARRLEDRIASVRQEVSSLQQEKAGLLEKLQEDKQRALRRKKEQLRKEIDQLDQKLREKSSELISPGRMAKQLRSVLKRSAELQLTRMANRPPSKVELANLIDASKQLEGGALPELYRHPLTITFKGTYSQAVNFFNKMQDMSSRFFWDRLEFTIIEHPVARVDLTVHTLSLDKAWIGF
jgi:MSHA biogenesis protein MshJ